MTLRSRLAALVALPLLLGACTTDATDSREDQVASSPAPEERAIWWPTPEEERRARELADGLTLEQLAGQLLIVRHFSNDQSLALVRDQHFAGVMVTGDRILDITTNDPLSSVTAFNDQIRALGEQRGIPTLIPIDQEGGLVARLRAPLTEFPTHMSAGAAIAGDPGAAEVVEAAAKASGAELRAAGFNAAFAPVADVTIGPEDPIIGSRSAGSDPQVVAAAVAAVVRGYGEAGVLTSVKHFPGHNVDEDSHHGLPVLDSDVERLRSHDLVPFLDAIDLAAPAIMTGHLSVTALDPGVPASLSRAVITGELRERLGYDGLIISDSLGMGAVHNANPDGKAALEALKAGSDLALMPADNLAAYEAVLAALASGEYDEQQARDSAARVIAHALHVEDSGVTAEAGSSIEASTALSAAAVTLATCDPIEPVDSVIPAGNAESVARFREAAAELGFGTGSGPVVRFIGYGGGGTTGDIVVATDTPYALARSSAPTKIALYGRNLGAMRALVAVLRGDAEAPGALPVDAGLPAC